MKSFFLTFSLLLFFGLGQVQAQTYMYSKDAKPTKKEQQLDQNVLTCVKDKEGFSEDFKFSEWISAMHYYNRKMLQRVSAEFAGDIASFKPQVIILAELAGGCASLTGVKKELQAIKKVYENIKIEQESNDASLFGGESTKATMHTQDAQNIIKQLDKLRKKLQISSVIIRIMD